MIFPYIKRIPKTSEAEARIEILFLNIYLSPDKHEYVGWQQNRNEE